MVDRHGTEQAAATVAAAAREAQGGLPAPIRLALLSACGACASYVGWLGPQLTAHAPGALRAMTALAAGAVIAAAPLRRVATAAAPRQTRSRTLPGAVAVAAAIAATSVAVYIPELWGGALALNLAAVCATLAGLASIRQQWIPLALLLSAAPYEALLQDGADRAIQSLTATVAVPLVRLTGLPVTLRQWQNPALVGQDLVVHVTAMCAGTQTLLALWTLGLVLAAAFLPPGRARLYFVALTPLFGFSGNVLRVAASTHAANAWANDPWAWALAHDGIGYAAFALVYAGLFLVVRTLRSATEPQA